MLHGARNCCGRRPKTVKPTLRSISAISTAASEISAARSDAEFNPMTWYLRAAEAGNVEAQFTLGTMYLSGNDIERDLEAAAAWFTQGSDERSRVIAVSAWRAVLHRPGRSA